MKIEVNGVRYSNFLEATADVRIDTLSNTFSFSSGPGGNGSLPFGMGSECAVYVDDERIITGHIEVISGRGSANDHQIDIIGRDLTGDIVDSSIGSLTDINAPIKLKRIVEIVIQHIGSDIDVVDLTGVSYNVEDIIAPEPGDNAFTFLEKIARKKNVILSSNSDGDVVIQRAEGVDVKAKLVNRIDGKGNNIISYSFTYDDTGRFNRYEAIGNSNMNILALLGKQQPKKVVDQRGFITDRRMREGRQLIIASENPGSSPNMKERAEWEANIRKARSRVYSATLSGYRNQAGELWTPNTIVQVIDENAEINDRMLINAVTYRLDPDSGRTTELNLINKNAYSLEVAEPTSEKAEFNIEAALARANQEPT